MKSRKYHSADKKALKENTKFAFCNSGHDSDRLQTTNVCIIVAPLMQTKGRVRFVPSLLRMSYVRCVCAVQQHSFVRLIRYYLHLPHVVVGRLWIHISVLNIYAYESHKIESGLRSNDGISICCTRSLRILHDR